MRTPLWTLPLALALALALALPHGAQGLLCYACQVAADAEESPCMKDPATIYPVDCNVKYCTTRRVEFTLDGSIQSFARTCEDNPHMLNDTEVSALFITHYTACEADLCNSGDGIPPGWTGGGGGGVILVPGKPAAPPLLAPAAEARP